MTETTPSSPGAAPDLSDIESMGYEQARDYRSAIQFASHHALEALHVFRSVDLGADDPRILPFVLFLCAQLDEHDIRNGTARVDGTLETLSTADIERILVLKEEPR